ncbi:MAG: hypothetical protein J0L52_05145 [Caulobacterales bacterium]|nr:hypothetical protein [Caulobacterales bacterium]
MTRRAAQPVPPFSPLERAAMRALSWELAPDFPELEGLADEARPGRWFQGLSGFVRRTAMASLRPGRTRGQSGVFGSVHAVLDGVAEPVSFQLQLRRGRLVALIADAYGQDVSHIDFATVRFDQLFYLDAEGRSRPLDARLVRKAPTSTAGLPGRGVVIQTVPPPVAVQRRTAVPVQSGVILPPTRTEQALENAGEAAAKGLLKLAIWVVVLSVAFLAWTLLRVPVVLAFIAAFWIGRAMTKGMGFKRMEQAFANRRERLMG